MTDFSFRLTHTDGAARSGVMTTPHGTVETPAFMAVGTQGAVKGITHRDLEGAGSQILLSNTYHLYLRPGDDLIARRGGLHQFIGWTRPILTDSGGYQVFSLAERRTIDENGARFKSHLDGSSHLLTPERAADIQAQLGSDVAMVLDECLAYPATIEAARTSMEMTSRWAARARQRWCMPAVIAVFIRSYTPAIRSNIVRTWTAKSPDSRLGSGVVVVAMTALDRHSVQQPGYFR